MTIVRQQISLFEDHRLDLEGAIDLSLDSLREYGQRYRHWAIAYSGGKDSSAAVSFVAWAIRSDMVPRPDSLMVLYADTRLELPPLYQGALRLLGEVEAGGIDTQVVLPALDKRFFVYMLGVGVPPPHNGFRWCTEKMKIASMMGYLEERSRSMGQRLLTLTGIRLGESSARDQRIAVSCSRDSGECGQGWFQATDGGEVYDTLAPIVHWRLCHVFDWLYFEQERHGYDTSAIAHIYGDDDIRTGCIECPLVNEDKPLRKVVRSAGWAHLMPLLELRPLYEELRKPKNRLRKSSPETRKDGSFGRNPGRLGPLTMEVRAYGLERVLEIQGRAQVDLINAEEEARIRELWALGTWPQGWLGDEVTGDMPVDGLSLIGGGDIAVQALLVR